VGIGIDESMALVVSPQGPWEVIGASQATIYDARRATVTPAGRTLGASEIRMHVVPAGGTFDLATGTAIVGEK